jgi:ADP-heptose:LPS heptosyltransferase
LLAASAPGRPDGPLVLLHPGSGDNFEGRRWPSASFARLADRLVRTMLKRPVGPPFNYRLAPGAVRGLLALTEDAHMNPAPQVHRHRLPAGTAP